MKDFKLDNEPKIETGFTIPEGYFDAFEEKMMERLSENEPKVISIKKRNWYLAVAATLVIALTIPIVTQLKSQSNTVDKATLENYLANHEILSNDELANMLDATDIQKLNIDLDLENGAIEDALLTNPDLEEYLIN